MNGLKMNNYNSQSIRQMTELFTGGNKKDDSLKSTAKAQGNSFEDIFASAVEDKESLRFSKHASERLESRGINLSKEQLDRLENGTEKAREKGIQDSLVMVDDYAFIVNVKKNMVITAMDDSSDAVFTNIDGAVIN